MCGPLAGPIGRWNTWIAMPGARRRQGAATIRVEAEPVAERLDPAAAPSRDSVEQPPALPDHRPRRRGNAAAPLHVRVELVLVDGEAGKELARRQAAAIRAVLEWVRDHPVDQTRCGDSA